jgi:hypothetical protein
VKDLGGPGGIAVTEVASYGLAVTKVTGTGGGLGVTFVSATGGPALPVLTTFATFNGTPSAGIVLSNGNRTVTHGTTNNGAGVQSTTTLSSGKYYFEIKVQTSFGNAEGFGIKTNLGGTFIEGVGNAPNGVGVSYGTGTTKIYTNSVDSGKALGVTAVNDVFGAAIDLTARLVWFRRNNGNWNGDAAADPATGANGVVVPAGALSPYVRFTNSGATDVQAANFGQAAFAFTPPSGFILGWGT